MTHVQRYYGNFDQLIPIVILFLMIVANRNIYMETQYCQHIPVYLTERLHFSALCKATFWIYWQQFYIIVQETRKNVLQTSVLYFLENLKILSYGPSCNYEHCFKYVHMTMCFKYAVSFKFYIIILNIFTCRLLWTQQH